MTIRTILIGALLFQYSLPAQAEARCPSAANWNLHAATAYLLADSESQVASCTSQALLALADPEATPDPTLLTRYLGFMRPDLHGLNMLTIDTVEDFCPGVKALVVAGERSLPALVDVLSANREEHERRNAVRAVKLILHRNSLSTIEFLLDAAEEAPGTAHRRLEDAARLAGAWCGDLELAECDALLDKRLTGLDTASVPGSTR
ncbi:MAG: hypothetical protein GC160_15715 [Acidobacteria bacterium]|nr:hypothetical protein [Acidobacteriota bacterium]